MSGAIGVLGLIDDVAAHKVENEEEADDFIAEALI
jgi:hypothetical protein